MVFFYKNAKRLAFFAALLLHVVAYSQQPGVVRCYTDEMHAIRSQNDPSAESLNQFEEWIQDQIQNPDVSRTIGGVYQIPVVVHVIHNGEAIGTGTNVSLAAIQSQIDVLNEDFRRIMGSNGYNTDPLGADTQIEFCLAKRRPDGSAFPTEAGVNRINRTTAGFSAPPYTTAYIDATIKTYTYNNNTPAIVSTWARGWDPNKYMNIWLCNISGGILGYAQFPESPLGGMDAGTGTYCGTQSAATDGVVFLYNSIGKSSVTGFAGPYNEGRTATHEIGHWLGLRHIWGDGGCTVDDFCNDTPLAAAANFGCPTINSCTNAPDPGNDMVNNYMDYTDDLCMDIFTIDQKARMRTVLENSPRRFGLINSDACIPPATNDASVIDVITPKGDNCAGSLTPIVTIKNRGSATLTSCVVNYKIDNGTVTTFNYTGSLVSGGTANVTLPVFTTFLGVHTITSWTTLPNNVADPNPALDTTQLSFSISNGINAPYVENFDGQVFPPDLRWVVENSTNDCWEWISGSAVNISGTFNNNAMLFPGFQNTSAQTDNVITPIFTLPCNASAANIQFDVAYRRRNNTAANYERLYVEISTDCGATWNATPIYDKTGTTLQVLTTTTTAYYQPVGITDWRTETVDLLSFVTPGASRNVKFRFRAVAANGNNIWIDNFKFNATSTGEAKLTVAGTEILDGGGYTYTSTAACNTTTTTFTVNNTGTSALTLTGPIAVTGTGFSLGTSFGTTTVAAGGSTTFTVNFSPTAAGSYNGTVSFGTNDCDEATYDFQVFGTATGGACASANFTMNPNPVCQGQTVTFTSTSTGATSYAWNFGAGATPATATTVGPHTVTYATSGAKTVTLQINGTGPTSTQTLTVNALPATPTITAGGPTTFCSGGSVTLTAPASTSYLWSTGATTQSITVTTSGSYTVQVTNASGCQSAASAATTVTVNPAPATPTITAGGPTTFCSGGSVTLTSSSATGNVWSTGATTQSITVSTAGSYTVTVTSAGCSATSAATTVTVNALPTTPTITAGGPTTFCSGGSVTLTAPASTSYLWSTGATTQSITVTTSGSYTVQVTNASGCQSAASAATTVTVNPAPATPTITAGGPTTFCSGGSVTLTSSSATGNVWSTGSTTQSITVSTAGSYTVTVTSAGCSATSAATTVTVNALPAVPTITAGGPTTFCSGGSVTLTATAGATSYLWSNGATTQAITVTTAGSYTVTVSNASGCTRTSAATTVTVNPTPATPTITAGGPTTFCSPGSVTLTSSSATGNSWSTGATTQSITVSASGSYTVTVTSGGCSATSAATIVTATTTPSTPTITASGPTTFCTGGSVTLTSSAGSGNTWSTGATTPSITVSAAGSYTVTVGAAGCSATSTATTVTVNALPTTPTITASGPTTFCSGGSVTLSAPTASSYAWSNGATTQSITVTAAGSYSVQVTNASGCQSAASAATTVTVNALPATPTITAGGPTTFCAGGSVTLSAPAASSYAWSNGATTQSITVTAAGSYSVQVTNASGCQSAASVATTVTVNALPTTPTISAGGPTTFCAGGSVVLSAPSSTSYLWSDGSTSQSISVTNSGTYTVQVSDGNGCQSPASASTTVTVNALPATPSITASGSTTFCAGGSVILSAPASSTYLWSDGSTSSFITVSNSGTYTVQVTNASGCQSAVSAPITVTVNALPATPTITASGATQLCGNTVDLSSSASSGNVWSTGETTSTITVASAGSYTVTVSDVNGCSSTSAPVVVTTGGNLPTPTIATSGSTTVCEGKEVVLISSSATGNNWSTGETTQSIVVSAAGTYSVFVDNGVCTSNPASISVTVNPNPVVTLGNIPTMCINHNAATLNQGSPVGGVYSGTGVTGNLFDPAVSGLGAFIIDYEFTDANGCSGIAQNTIIVDDCLGIDELDEALVVYPNPANSVINIDHLPANTAIELFDGFGKLVNVKAVTTENGITQLNVSDLATGIYYVRFTGNEINGQVSITVSH